MRSQRLLVLLFAANAVAVTAIWWTALEPVTHDPLVWTLNAAGRLAALLGTYLVLVQLVLRTHVPWLVRAFGKEDLKRWHTWNGYLGFGLIGAHFALQLVGYALSDRIDVISEGALLLARYEGMLPAYIALLMLAGLSMVAIERFRHRIPWPTWRALHLFTYAAVALSVPHQIATGSDFIDAPLAAAYWVALEAAVLVIVLAARIPPAWRALTVAGRPQPAVAGVALIALAGAAR